MGKRKAHVPALRGFDKALIAILFLAVAASRGRAEPAGEGLALFEKRIRPVLVKHCYKCHSAEAEKVEGGLLLDTREGIRKGGDSGHAVVPRDGSNSLLLQAIQYESFEMPPDQRLPQHVIQDFERWIEIGAPDPREGKVLASVGKEAQTSLWSLRAVQPTVPPRVVPADWPHNDIDRFVLQKLHEQKLQPVSTAEPHRLLRRLYFDLVGLPPPAEVVREFARDPTQASYARIVDRLLESPRFGERWARHWLDVVRFAESNGRDRDVLLPHAWRYRRYVIDAFNHDVPYDRFLTEQIAGDLLAAETAAQRDRLRIATGMLAVGSKSLTGGGLQMDLIDDQIDVVSRAVLGLTVSCARCHDHKFDPIPTRDYYALAGIFRSTETRFGGGLRRPNDRLGQTGVLFVLGADAEQRIENLRQLTKSLETLQKEQKQLTRQIQKLQRALPQDSTERSKLIAGVTKAAVSSDPPTGGLPTDPEQLESIRTFVEASQRLDHVRQELTSLEQQRPELEFAMGVGESSEVGDCLIHIRGERDRLGEAVPRGFLSCIQPDEPPVIDASQSGRRELAEWLTHPRNPLTARVEVNRIWQHLFGRGLVESVDNFGVAGSPPTHPLLLDYLAHEFVGHGWSRKTLIRRLVFSRTYQLAGEFHAANYELDPDNRYYWRARRRRLEAEAIRDAMLSASGLLDVSPPARSPVAEIGNGEFGRGIDLSPIERPFPYRSVYLPILRGLVPQSLKVFDFPEPSNIQGQRDVTNVPAQSLYLMNNAFVIEQAEQFARRLLDSTTLPERVSEAFLIAYGRPPSAAEEAQSRLFVRQFGESAEDESGWFSFCQALFAGAEFRYLQ